MYTGPLWDLKCCFDHLGRMKCVWSSLTVIVGFENADSPRVKKKPLPRWQPVFFYLGLTHTVCMLVPSPARCVMWVTLMWAEPPAGLLLVGTTLLEGLRRQLLPCSWSLNLLLANTGCCQIKLSGSESEPGSTCQQIRITAALLVSYWTNSINLCIKSLLKQVAACSDALSNNKEKSFVVGW